MDGVSKLRLFFFSGTGNARRVAQWTRDAAADRGMTVEAVSVEGLSAPPAPPAPNELLGFIFPVHGFITVWIMLKFILRFPRATVPASAFTITTLGGCKFGRLFVPGWEGSGLYLPLIILRLKGYRWAGALPLRNTPVNWTSFAPAQGRAARDAMMERTRGTLSTFTKTIFEGKIVLHGIVSFLFGMAALPISIPYLLFGRFGLAKTMFHSSQCTGCGLCAQYCPVSAIRMVHDRPFWKLTCESCMRCMNFCPQRAVQASLPLGVAFWILALRPLNRWIATQVSGWDLPSAYATHALAWIASYPIMLMAMAGAYGLWWTAMRWKPVLLLFEYIAPTRYFASRHRAPGTDLKNIRSA